ncbi:MAG: hypothetical protein SPL69_04920 [Succinivibrionaceae bacterium]|nr:hypothetical protein [Succinivibrionaceae bacterium]
MTLFQTNNSVTMTLFQMNNSVIVTLFQTKNYVSMTLFQTNNSVSMTLFQTNAEASPDSAGTPDIHSLPVFPYMQEHHWNFPQEQLLYFHRHAEITAAAFT